MGTAMKKPVYATRILKGAGLVTYAKDLLAEWDEKIPFEENLAKFRRSGMFGKASAARAGDVLSVLNTRYLHDESTRRGLVRLRRARPAPPTLELVLGFHAAMTDQLLFDFAADFLFDRRERGLTSVSQDDAIGFLTKLGVARPPYAWSSRTITRVARQLLTAWRDFGLLTGTSRKRLTDRPVPIPAFLWVAAFLKESTGSTAGLFHDRAFRLLLLSPTDVESMFASASRQGWLQLSGGGPLARIEWRYTTVEEVASALS
jgi:hypothetical protein